MRTLLGRGTVTGEVDGGDGVTFGVGQHGELIAVRTSDARDWVPALLALAAQGRVLIR